MNLKNKKVLITGATGGIGKCLVDKFHNLGALIVASGTNEKKLNDYSLHAITYVSFFKKKYLQYTW